MTRTPTIALFSGSLRDGSTNSATLRTVAQLLPAGARAVPYTGMGALPHFSPDLDTADPHPEVAALRELIADCDAMLFCTPEYAGSLPGSFKNMLDWTIGGVETQDKVAAWINVSSSVTRAEGAHRTLRDVLRYTGVRLSGDACVHVPVPRGSIDRDTGLVRDPQVREVLERAGQSLVSDIEEVRADIAAH